MRKEGEEELTVLPSFFFFRVSYDGVQARGSQCFVFVKCLLLVEGVVDRLPVCRAGLSFSRVLAGAVAQGAGRGVFAAEVTLEVL